MRTRRPLIVLPCLIATLAVCLLGANAVPVRAADEHPLLGVLSSELKLSADKLATPDGARPYFIQYTITDLQTVSVAATLGAVIRDDVDHARILDVDLRCGDYALDNTHQIRGGGYFGSYDRGGGWVSLPLNGDALATRQAIWLATDRKFKSSVKRLAQVRANVKVKVEEEDKSDDFSREQARQHIGPLLKFDPHRTEALEMVRRLSRRFRSHPAIYNSGVTLTGMATNRFAVSTEGSRLQFGRGWWRVGIQASTIADDGMELFQYTSFDAHSFERLPDEDEIAAGVERVIAQVLALREAPVVEPYAGPAILQNRASAVFFHEIFGHRIEGHRQKDVEEGQTFAKKIGKPVLPDFLSVVDDPSRRTFGNTELNGHYLFDEELVPSQAAQLVENGILKTFLMSRSPTRGINNSNGHGRRQPGMRVVARQGNLIVESSASVPIAELRRMLIDQCKEHGKEFGLLFTDISGGFTNTRTRGPQAFKVLPIMVYLIYTDGRPDKLVRGVDMVGTPLTSFSKILATGDDPGVFNGMCGAESGMVPVSAISPSILVEQIEIEKKQKAQDLPPILPAPIAGESGPRT